ncbi:calmodulin-like [Saccostrea cucullata]|uniref:calmodulin-like n=1 Tax=Saccostrea cuccullata TaxID=36930 RepID=UPI002ED3813C
MSSRRKKMSKKVKIPEGMSETDFKEILTSFDVIDTNKDGSLSRAEMRDAARVAGMNPTDKELEDWFIAADTNGDGLISLEEYINIMSDNYVTVDIEQERMKTAFRVIDKNGDGKISLEEFRTVMLFNNVFTQEEADKLFQEVDSDGKGYINYNDFISNHMYDVLF